ncbi:MAG: hypothetical protein U0R65_11360 [Candidatus Nanopelagicales bacterium]
MPEIEGVPPAVPGDSADLAFERIVVETLARTPEAARQTGIPGIAKAQERLVVHQRLDPRGYLKSPRVFGFHGIYRPFATATGLVDASGNLLSEGRTLLEAVQSDHRLSGLLDLTPGSAGRSLVAWLIDETRRGLLAGSNVFSATNKHLPMLVSLTAPEGAGKRERRALREAMNVGSMGQDPSDMEAFVEILSLIETAHEVPFEGEPSIAAYLARHGTPTLRVRMRALEAYEGFAQSILWAFDTYRWLATSQACLPSDQSVAENNALRTAAARLPRDFATAAAALERLSDQGTGRDLQSQFIASFAAFGEPRSARDLVSVLMERHLAVQSAKPPSGKRPWFDLIGSTYAVRPMYALGDEPARYSSFVHPYRFTAILNFLADAHE